MALLDVTHLSLDVASRRLFRRKGRRILNDVSLAIEAGSTVGLVGESGSGKTSLARCIAGLTTPSAGSIRFDGIDLFPGRENRDAVGIQIQLLFQNHAATLDPRMTIHDSILEGVRKRIAPSEEDRILSSLLAMVELSSRDILTRYPAELSGGERQRVALARTLSVAPKLLLLDEPTSSVDALTQTQLLDTMAGIQRDSKLAILFISHDLPTTLRFCKTIAVMHKGTIVESGPSQQLLEHPSHPYTQSMVNESF